MGIFDVASEKKTASGQEKMIVLAELLTQVILILLWVVGNKNRISPIHTEVLLPHESIYTIAHPLTIMSTRYTMASTC